MGLTHILHRVGNSSSMLTMGFLHDVQACTFMWLNDIMLDFYTNKATILVGWLHCLSLLILSNLRSMIGTSE